MPRKSLTAAGVQALVPTSKRVEYFDTRLPGFYVCVHPSGKKTYGVFYRFKGRGRRFTIGPAYLWTLADARTRARQALLWACTGERDLAAEKRRVITHTFEDVCNEYMERWSKPRKKSWREDQRIIRKNLLPRFGRLAPEEITRADMRRMVDDIARKTPKQAGQVLARVRHIFNWAISQDLAAVNPCSRIPAPATPQPRKRVLSDGEIRIVWHALEDSESPHADTYKIILLTAQRGGEVRGMLWSEIDLAAAVWTIPASRSKNGQPHRVPLSPPALRILERRHDAGGEYVFPGRNGGGSVPHTKWMHQKLVRASALDEPWNGHDLRRTAATKMVELGTSVETVGRVLNHAEHGSVTMKHYVRHSWDAEKRDALDAWARRLMVLVSGLEVVATGV